MDELVLSLNEHIDNINIIQMFGFIALTLLAYIGATYLHRLGKFNPLLHPLVTSACFIIAVLLTFEVELRQYQQATWLITYLLGPATVALAIPLYRQLRALLRLGWRLVLPILFGGALAPTLAWLSIYFFNTPTKLQMTMLVKSITTPLAMGTADAIGGLASLAAVFVIVTGIVGAVFAPLVFKIAKVHSHMAEGVALGTVAHAVGTSKAISISETCAAFATLAVCLNGMVTAFVLPLLFA